jgi:dTDP-4-dehydrorhamnose reductase
MRVLLAGTWPPVASGETSWHGFAAAIVGGLKERKITLAVERVKPIPSAEYSARATRPRNSRLDFSRLHKIFDITTPHWRDGTE